TACERAVRVAKRVGAEDVYVVESDASRAGLVEWRRPLTGPVLVIRADQLVHTPLVEPLVAALSCSEVAIAVVPDDPAVNDLTVGAYAGAFVVAGPEADDVVAALARGDSDAAVVERFSEPLRVAHG